jgi:hypothetical protein
VGRASWALFGEPVGESSDVRGIAGEALLRIALLLARPYHRAAVAAWATAGFVILRRAGNCFTPDFRGQHYAFRNVLAKKPGSGNGKNESEIVLPKCQKF